MLKKWWVFIFLCIGITSYAQQTAVHKIESKNFKNLYRLNNSLFRSEQPGKKGFKELELLGIKTVINLRRQKKDDRKARETGLQLVKVPLKAGRLTEEEIVTVLKAIQTAQDPVLVHCWHGSDRTGAIAAAYRIVFENWSRQKAIAELRIKSLGYHEKMYPNLIPLIENLNIARVRKELGISSE